jgi:hypothetical protein
VTERCPRCHSLNARIALLETESNLLLDVGRTASPTIHTRLRDVIYQATVDSLPVWPECLSGLHNWY